MSSYSFALPIYFILRDVKSHPALHTAQLGILLENTGGISVHTARPFLADVVTCVSHLLAFALQVPLLSASLWPHIQPAIQPEAL
jgi:hypothetical protein